MNLTTQRVAPDFWIVKEGRKYLGVVRFVNDVYVPWFEARQIGEPQATLEDAACVLAEL